MIIECRTTLVEHLVAQVLEEYGAAFERPPRPPYALGVVFAIADPLPVAARNTLAYFARTTYGIRMIAGPHADATGDNFAVT